MKDVSEFIESLLEDICLDDRIPNGTFNITDTNHLDLLHEYAAEKVDGEFATALMDALIIEEGNFPERQAYNGDGILVTFPDEESKKAALDRKTHTNNDPTGGVGNSEDESTSDNAGEDENPEVDTGDDEVGGEETEEQEPESIFADYTTPEEEFALVDPDTPTEYSEFEINPVKEPEDVNETHHIYDVLTSIKKSQLDDDTNEKSPTAMISPGELHPSILFALKQKWEFDKSGKWFDELGKFRAHTDKHGKLDPTKQEIKEEMEIWLEDYLKRNPDAKV